MTIDLTSALSRPDAAGVSDQLFQPRLIPRLREALRFRRYSLKTAKRLPTVLTRNEVPTILSQLAGTSRLMVSLLYGAGLRLNECLSLRVKDVDLDGSKLIVREGKGNKDRVSKAFFMTKMQ